MLFRSVLKSFSVIATLASHASVAVAAMKDGASGQFTGVVCVTHVMAGAVLSCTVMVLLQVDVLPQSSVAVHVLVMLYVPAQLPAVLKSFSVIATLASHASVAVAAVKDGASGQFTGVVCVAHVIVGAVLS